jgi:hypothetical protein
VGFDLDAPGVEPDQGMGDRPREHGASVGGNARGFVSALDQM